MGISIRVAKDQEDTLRGAWGDELDRAALEALAIEGYRSGKFGSATLRNLLKLRSRAEVDRWLAERGVPLNYTPEDLDADRRTLDRLFPESD